MKLFLYNVTLIAAFLNFYFSLNLITHPCPKRNGFADLCLQQKSLALAPEVKGIYPVIEQL